MGEAENTVRVAVEVDDYLFLRIIHAKVQLGLRKDMLLSGLSGQVEITVRDCLGARLG